MHDDKVMRDLFAAYAISAVTRQLDVRSAEVIASQAYAIADAMMVERKKRLDREARSL